MRVSEGYAIAEEVRGSAVPLSIPRHTLEECSVAAEYVELCRSPVDDVYVTICPTDKKIFHGVIFVRKGFFGGGIFRFNVRIPDNFPNTMDLPTVVFEKEIFHPSIAMKTRELDLSRSFPDGWKPDRHSVRRVIIVVQRTFYSLEINMDKSRNPEAALLLKDHRNKFKEISMHTVEASRALVYEEESNLECSSSIKFLPWDKIVHESAREKLLMIGDGKQISGTASELRRHKILASCGLQFSDLIGKSYPLSYSWFDSTEMSIVTTHKIKQENGGLMSSARQHREKHGIEPLDLSEITS